MLIFESEFNISLFSSITVANGTSFSLGISDEGSLKVCLFLGGLVEVGLC